MASSSICANCEKTFKKKTGDKGYYRYSLENQLGSNGNSAREELEQMTGDVLTPVGKKMQGRFLCPECWSQLGNVSKYKLAFEEFFGATESASYVASKRPTGDTGFSPSTSFKRPRYTSTPLKVSYFAMNSRLNYQRIPLFQWKRLKHFPIESAVGGELVQTDRN